VVCGQTEQQAEDDQRGNRAFGERAKQVGWQQRSYPSIRGRQCDGLRIHRWSSGRGIVGSFGDRHQAEEQEGRGGPDCSCRKQDRRWAQGHRQTTPCTLPNGSRACGEQKEKERCDGQAQAV
jgi:hypothetical protein